MYGSVRRAATAGTAPRAGAQRLQSCSQTMSRALKPSTPEQRQHPERVYEIGQRLGCVVDWTAEPRCTFRSLAACINRAPRSSICRRPKARRSRAPPNRCPWRSGNVAVVLRLTNACGPDRRPSDRRNPCGGHHAGDAAIERELDQHPGGGGHGLGDRLRKLRRPPMEQRAQHQEQQLVGVEIRHRSHRIFANSCHSQPAASDATTIRRRIGLYSSHLPGRSPRPVSLRAAHHVLAHHLGGHGPLLSDGAEVRPSTIEITKQDGRDQRGLPEENRRGERMTPASKQCGRQAAGIGLQLRGR